MTVSSHILAPFPSTNTVFLTIPVKADKYIYSIVSSSPKVSIEAKYVFLKENSDRKIASSSVYPDSIKPFKSSSTASTVKINQGMLNSSSWGFPFPQIRQNSICIQFFSSNYCDLAITGQADCSISCISCHRKN